MLTELGRFTPAGGEQEDDITLVTLRRASGVAEAVTPESTLLTQFSVPGEEGNERLVMDRVAASVADLGLDPARLERLKTAVSEAAICGAEVRTSAAVPSAPMPFSTVSVGASGHARVGARTSRRTGIFTATRIRSGREEFSVLVTR